MTERIDRLIKAATQIRRDVVNTIYCAGDGHPGPCMSIVDVLATLYFGIMKVDAENPLWMQRDRFILSKGHACPAWYATLARKGFFEPSELKTLRSLGARLQGHPVMQYAPGIDATSGSLGHGLSQGTGMALAARKRGDDNMIFVLTGDGELNEGINWEAAMTISKYKLSNIVAIVDNNGIQSGGTVDKIGGLYPLKEKWESFGWYAIDIDGHKIEDLLPVFEKSTSRGRLPIEKQVEMEIIPGMKAVKPGQPIVLIAHTIKGKGVPFMEGNNAWHKKVPNDEERKLAMSFLGGLDLE